MIDVHNVLTNNKIGKELFKPRFSYKYCGLQDDNLEDQMTMDKDGNILSYKVPFKNKEDQICSIHDRDYHFAKNKEDKLLADKKMIERLDAIPYNDRSWGHFAIRNIINTKRKLGLSIYKQLKINKIIKEQNNMYLVEIKNYPNEYILVQKEFLYNI